MGKPKIISDWLQGKNFYYNEYDLVNHHFNKNVEIYVDTFPSNKKYDGTIRFLLLVEPIEMNGLNNIILNSGNLFDYILTYEESILSTLKNSLKFEYGTTWIDYHNYSFTEKNFSISTFFTQKRGLGGYELRNSVYQNKHKFKIETNFFNGNGFNDPKLKNLGEFKHPLFNSMFNICIENVKKQNFFTEKLIDCFITKTIPIYYGCKNINEYFNEKGFYIVDSFEDIINISNNLSEVDYYDKLKYVEDNFERSKQYCDLRKRIVNKIEEIIG